MPTEAAARLLVFGSINVDLVCRVAAIPKPGETVLSPSYEQLFGGKGANQAVAAARALGVGEESHHGQAPRVAIAGAIGRDELGSAARTNLQREGIDLSLLQEPDAPTGCAFITIDAAGENAITVASGANRLLSAGRVPEDAFRDVGVLVLQMEVPEAETIRVARRLRADGARVVLNLAPVPADLTRERLEALLAVCDVLVVNEMELTACASLFGEDPAADPRDLAQALSGRLGIALVATLGARGALLVRTDAEPVAIAAMPVSPVDTTGAGDTFVGVLAAGICETRDLSEATRRAVAAASLACLGLGAQTAMPRRAAIDVAVRSAE